MEIEIEFANQIIDALTECKATIWRFDPDLDPSDLSNSSVNSIDDVNAVLGELKTLRDIAIETKGI